MTRFATTFTLLLFVLATRATAQHDHARELSVQPAAAQYLLQARPIPGEPAYQVWMELVYTSHFRDTVPSLLFSLPDKEDLTFDSILYLGAPLDGSRIMRQNNFLALEVTLAPRESAPLLFSFKLRVEQMRRLLQRGASHALVQQWHPVILARQGDNWAVGGDGMSPLPEIGDYRVEIMFDSSFQIIAPGQFVNEVEHLGLIPDRQDTVITELYPDLAASSKAFRSAHFVANGCERFDFALVRQPQASRIVYRRQKIDLYSAEWISDDVSNRFITKATEISRRVIDLLGPLPDGRLMAFLNREEFDLGRGGRMATISTSSRDPKIVLADLTVALTSQYFTSSLPDTGSLFLSYGASVFFAATVLHDLYGCDGYAMLSEWIDWRLPPRDPRSFFGPPAFAWMENIRKPNRPWSTGDSLLYQQIVVAPSALQILASTIEVLAVNNALIGISLSARHRHVSDSEIIGSLNQATNQIAGEQMRAWQWPDMSFDWSIKDAKLVKESDSFIVSGILEAECLFALPVEVAVVTGKDTLVQIVTSDASNGGSTRFSLKLGSRPLAITADPHHRLPDRNRQNNRHLFQFGQSRQEEQIAEFPTFRRLMRGD